MDTYGLLARAIAQREQVIAVYDGKPREFCPHALGSKQDRQHVLAYQFGGGSTTSLPVAGEWRCFAVDGLSDVQTRAGPWHTATNLFNPQSCLDVIDVAVEPFPPRQAKVKAKDSTNRAP